MKYLILVIILSGCATRGEYWIKDSPQIPINGIYKTDRIYEACNARSYGCFYRNTGLIFIDSTITDPIKLACILSHEKHHAEGYSHPNFNNESVVTSIVCGDGTVMP